MTDVFHVRPYLMRASRLEAAFHECNVSHRLEYFIVRYRRASMVGIGKGSSDPAVFETSPNIYIDCSGLFFKFAPYKRPICSLDGMVKELLRKACHCEFCFADDQQSRCVFVDSMDKT